MKKCFSLLILCSFWFFLGLSTISATEYYVDNVKGSDKNDGRTERTAFATIQKGVSKLKAGDKLFLTNTGKIYYEWLFVTGKFGTREAPIVIDGRGATLSGARPIQLGKPWKALGNDLYVAHWKMGAHIAMRFYILFNGKMNRMGNIMKCGRKVQFKEVRDLLPNQWTWRENESKLYIKLPKGADFNAANLEYPALEQASGLYMPDKCSYVTVCNLTVQNFYNDGYNIHNDCSNISLRNVKALYNGDDGLSVHERVTLFVDGYYAEGNATGIYHVGEAVAVHRNVILQKAEGIELGMINKKNVFENVIVESTAISGPVFTGEELIINNMRLTFPFDKKKVLMRTKKQEIKNFEVINDQK